MATVVYVQESIFLFENLKLTIDVFLSYTCACLLTSDSYTVYLDCILTI